MSNNLSLKAYNRSDLPKLPIGTPIFDGNMDIYTKCPNDIWECETGRRITTAALLRYPHTPLRPYIPAFAPTSAQGSA